jgi:hypothetical protein
MSGLVLSRGSLCLTRIKCLTKLSVVGISGGWGGRGGRGGGVRCTEAKTFVAVRVCAQLVLLFLLTALSARILEARASSNATSFSVSSCCKVSIFEFAADASAASACC